MASLSALTPPARWVQDTALQTASPAALRRGGMNKGFLEGEASRFVLYYKSSYHLVSLAGSCQCQAVGFPPSLHPSAS